MAEVESPGTGQRDAIELRALCGADVRPFLDDVARLRVEVFRAWPYLYDGDAGYERNYLGRYVRDEESVVVLAVHDGRVVGASTGLPLAHDEPAFRQPFVERGMDVGSVYYCGESVLLPDFRGQGLGHRFFDLREAHARALGRFRVSAFAAVDRAPDDPRRPLDFRGNDAFWHKRGYVRQPGMTMRLAWKEPDANAESEKLLTVWLRQL